MRTGFTRRRPHLVSERCVGALDVVGLPAVRAGTYAVTVLARIQALHLSSADGGSHVGVELLLPTPQEKGAFTGCNG
eukprot:3126411-Rhodomonas_salina.1